MRCMAKWRGSFRARRHCSAQGATMRKLALAALALAIIPAACQARPSPVQGFSV
jgi:hypothetical protein